MIFVQPGQFLTSWDINIKVPLIIRNSLPFDVLIKTFDVLDYKTAQAKNAHPDNHRTNTASKKVIQYDRERPRSITLEKNGELCLNNYNLDSLVAFEFNLDISDATSSDCSALLMTWYHFKLPKDQYKSGRKTVELVDTTN